ncbi:MAG TPA: hypothetical protein VEL74_13120 [Thermoanaerobaculia bacterium]|nr:hypothetical protein [Thermoanaerobaculia bacterium]
MADEDIDTTDIPPLDKKFFANAELRSPRPKPDMAHQKPTRS